MPIGFASVVPGEFWFIREIFVAPEYRRCGVAATMVNKIVGQARHRGVACGIKPGNTASESLFLKAGFVHAYTYAVIARTSRPRVGGCSP